MQGKHFLILLLTAIQVNHNLRQDSGKKKPSIPAVLTVNISVCGILPMFVCFAEPTSKLLFNNEVPVGL